MIGQKGGEIFSNYKQFTNPNGSHALNVFVYKPFIGPAPETTDYV